MINKYLRPFLLKVNSDLFLIDGRLNYNSNHFKERFPELFKKEMDDLHKYIICLEDRRFLKHHGVDYKALCREILKFFCCKMKFKKYKRYGGASTIDMQLIRTLTGYRERTIKRKLYEMFLAHLINIKYEKRLIINSYIRYAFFGSNLLGLSDVIKNKSLSSLSKETKARIAAYLQKPRPIRATAEWKNKISKRTTYAQKIFHKLFDN